jgi:diaminohydroxyphosphoribosylaminopyrimidine deaminase/5-amino-6-(5-phosphoribosylamino)uracil reductase
MVGCVIVNKDKIIGEGWHQYFGGPHAEVNAINRVIDKEMIRGSDVYVNLEPCAHYGKTPPCAKLLSGHNVDKVIISNRDINPLVSGKGIEILRSAGIRVEEGILEKEGADLNRRFFTYHAQARPYIILKWAETADGFIARQDFDSKWISNEESRLLVHKWRSEEDGIMVGANTVLYDDPALNVRDLNGKDPIRIILDPHLKIKGKYKIFDRHQKTLIYNLLENRKNRKLSFIKKELISFIPDILSDLKSKGIQSVLVEGGRFILEKVIEAGLWDEARIFRASKTFGKGLPAPQLLDSELMEEHTIFDDQLYIFKRRIS